MIALHRVPRIGTRGVALASAVGAVMSAGCVAGGVPARSHEQASQIVLGSDGHGVSVDHRIGVTFIFDRSAAGRYKQVAGRKVLAACDQITRSPGSQLLLDSSSAVSDLRAPNHRAAIYTGYGGRSDFCRLGLPLRNNKERVVATVPLS